MNWAAINSTILLSTIGLHEPYCNMPYARIRIIFRAWIAMEQETRNIALMQNHDDVVVTPELWHQLERERLIDEGKNVS